MPYRGLGAIPDPHDTRDFIFEAVPEHFIGAIPAAVDLRNRCSPVRDQGQQGSCTGFAIASGLREFMENANGHPKPAAELSPAFVYYEERLLEHSTNNCDAGAYIRDGLKVLTKQGVCPEAEAPYTDQACGKPSSHAATDAKKFKIKAYHRITTLSGLKRSLAAGNPTVLGIAVYESFEQPTQGHIPMPKPNEQLLGGHAVFCCGYHDDTKYDGGGYLIVKNSWGTAFGDKGYIYLPYAYVTPKLMSDIWTAN